MHFAASGAALAPQTRGLSQFSGFLAGLPGMAAWGNVGIVLSRNYNSSSSNSSHTEGIYGWLAGLGENMDFFLWNIPLQCQS